MYCTKKKYCDSQKIVTDPMDNTKYCILCRLGGRCKFQKPLEYQAPRGDGHSQIRAKKILERIFIKND